MAGVLIEGGNLDTETRIQKCHVNTGAVWLSARTGLFLPNVTRRSNKNDLFLTQIFKTLCFNHSFSKIEHPENATFSFSLVKGGRRPTLLLIPQMPSESCQGQSLWKELSPRVPRKTSPSQIYSWEAQLERSVLFKSEMNLLVEWVWDQPFHI